ncbi:mechanosensitive ion channel family protein [Flavobacterium agricola]|uniref:Mechanosensitive ion channel family protein n=1 Tax=Flavobacterium agricola TaxID=2870839 RepID=A0ABY6M054_9FLAO|nr:mechanosensitive ion channel family protein [Flavobacterium agricola]UYW01938.1 mechanosensitive ion channel family protein [Flavobacterium agricola]
MIESLIKILESWEIDIKSILAKIIIGSVVFLIFYILGRIFKHLSYRLNSKLLSKHPDLQTIFSAVIYYFFLLVGIYLFLQIVGLEQYFTKILAGAGIVGIIAGFALKDIASNAFSGMLLFIEKPFKKDDWVQLDGQFGKVTHIGLLTTIMANRSGQEVFISNQLIYSGSFINYSVYKRRSIKIQANVLQYPDIAGFKSLLLAEIKNVTQYIPGTDIQLYVLSLGINNSFTFEVYYWVYFEEELQFMNAVSDTILIMDKICKENKINIINTKWISDEDNTTSSGDYGSGG